MIIKNCPKSPATLALLKKVENIKLKWTAANANNINIKKIVPKLFFVILKFKKKKINQLKEVQTIQVINYINFNNDYSNKYNNHSL